MAEGWAKKLGRGIIKAYSAGSRPSGSVNSDAIKVMQEAGIDISKNESKGFMELKGIKFDYSITLGCQDTCPFIPAERHLEWKIEDPKGKGLEFFRKTRDIIGQKTEELISNINNLR